MIDSMEYHRVLSENKDSTIPKKEEATFQSEVVAHSIEVATKQGSPNIHSRKVKSPTRSTKSPEGSATRRVIMETDEKQDMHNLMVTGASINGSMLNIKRYSVN